MIVRDTTLLRFITQLTDMSSGPSGEFIYFGDESVEISQFLAFNLSLNLLHPLWVDIFKTGGKTLTKKLIMRK